MSGIEFRPVGELDETEAGDVVIDRRSGYWVGPHCNAIDQAIDDGDTVYLVEDGKRVAVITPLTATQG